MRSRVKITRKIERPNHWAAVVRLQVAVVTDHTTSMSKWHRNSGMSSGIEDLLQIIASARFTTAGDARKKDSR
jgi:hypothetical protein